MTTSIVIPIYNNWAGCHQLLFDIYKNCSMVEEVILIDDASPDEDVQQGITWWKSTHMLPIFDYKNDTNLGFLLSSNKGLKLAEEDFVWLISTDVRIHQDIVKYIASHVDDDIVGGRLLDWDTGWNFGIRYLEGWFLGTWQDNWKKLNYFDEQYAPNDMEDVDLSAQATKLGITLSTINDGYVSHEGAKSIGYSPEREAITIANKEKFRKKWLVNV
jgi:GT2 family glycosyltransferase